MKWLTVYIKGDGSKEPEAIVFNSTHVEQIIEALGGEIIDTNKKEDVHKARLFADGFNDGLKKRRPRFLIPPYNYRDHS